MMWFRPTPGSRELTSRWVDAIEKDDKLWDQNAFNDLVRSEGGCEGRGKAEPKAEDVDPGLFRAFGGRVVVGTLPVAQFANGHVFYAQRTHSRLGLAPYAVHNTFQYGGTPGKRHRMREANAWLGDALASSRGGAGGKRDERSEEEEALDGSPGGSDYFAGGFLSYDPAIPRDVDLEQFRERSHPVAKDDTFPVIATPDDPVVDAHARLVEYQLAQMYAAMAVASVSAERSSRRRFCAAWTGSGSHTTGGSRGRSSRSRSCARSTTSRRWSARSRASRRSSGRARF